MEIIKKINPFDEKELNNIMRIINSSYENMINRDIFMQCRDSIYTMSNFSHIKNNDIFIIYYGIIGCRRTTTDELNINKLKYYCQNNIIYSIEFLHYFYKYIENDESDKGDRYDVLKKLIDTCLYDKNDAFVVYRLKYPYIVNDYDMLVDFGFELDSYDEKNKIYTYMRPPKTS